MSFRRTLTLLIGCGTLATGPAHADVVDGLPPQIILDELPAIGGVPVAAPPKDPLAKLSRQEVVALLDHAEHAKREQALDNLLKDNTIDQQALRQLLGDSKPGEQRHRLIKLAEHHVLREIREQAFANQAQEVDEVFNRRESAAVGFSYAPVLASENPWADVPGVSVIATMPGFPGHAYLKPGDIITAIDGQSAVNRAQHQQITSWMSWRIAVHSPGDRISFNLLRDGKAITVSLVCAQSSALDKMYSTDGLKAAARSGPYERSWQQAREAITQGLSKPVRLEP